MFVSVGDGHCKAHEGLHQSNSEETFQHLSIHQQPRQQLVISHSWQTLLINVPSRLNVSKRDSLQKVTLQCWVQKNQRQYHDTLSQQTLSCSHRHASSCCAWNYATHTCLFTEPHILHCINILSPVQLHFFGILQAESPVQNKPALKSSAFKKHTQKYAHICKHRVPFTSVLYVQCL